MKIKLFYLKNGHFILKALGKNFSIFYLVKMKKRSKLFKIERRLDLKLPNLTITNGQHIMNSLSLPITSHYYDLNNLRKIITFDIQTLYLKINHSK